MENKIEFYVYVTTKEDGTLRMVFDEDIYYGETAEFRSHGMRNIGGPGAPLVFKLPIEHYFDHIAKTIPEQYRTERIQKWIDSGSFSKNQEVNLKIEKVSKHVPDFSDLDEEVSDSGGGEHASGMVDYVAFLIGVGARLTVFNSREEAQDKLNFMRLIAKPSGVIKFISIIFYFQLQNLLLDKQVAENVNHYGWDLEMLSNVDIVRMRDGTYRVLLPDPRKISEEVNLDV